MGTLQTLISLVVLIFVLSVIVQAVQDVLKSFLDTKASTLEGIINQFMGKHLNLSHRPSSRISRAWPRPLDPRMPLR